jgi:alginate O-acetyltransferase complex protein AlgI
MVFSSIIFIFWFLPLTLLAYAGAVGPWLTRCPGGRELSSRTGVWLGNAALLLASLLFYFWGEQKRIYILLAAIALNYAAGWMMGSAEGVDAARKRRRLVILGLTVAFNLGLLIYFKYMNFLAGVMVSTGISFAIEPVVLPLGISFFIFQAMSYSVDVYRGHVPPARDIVAFACYITMFPQLVAGPIVRYCDVATQLTRRVLSGEKLASGIRRFIIGLAKKVLIANQMAVLADQAYALPADEVTLGAAWIGTLAYTLQIYFDFSGYSDMAIGLGRMFGFEFLENFNYPYIARNVQDFWRRWHISLSTWFRDYLYIPLGGSRGSRARTYVNLCLVFALCGFWHGASLSFLLWGLYHGCFLVMERVWQGRGTSHRLVGHVYTMLVVMGGWVLFRAENIAQAMVFWKAMIGGGGSVPGGSEIWLWFGRDIQLAMVAGALFSTPVAAWAAHRLNGTKVGTVVYRWARWIAVVALFLACLPLLVADTYNPFIYFRF